MHNMIFSLHMVTVKTLKFFSCFRTTHAMHVTIIIEVNWCATENHSRVSILCCSFFLLPLKKGFMNFFIPIIHNIPPMATNNRTFLRPTALVAVLDNNIRVSPTNKISSSLELDTNIKMLRGSSFIFCLIIFLFQ